MSRDSSQGSRRVPRFLILVAGVLVWTSADGQRHKPTPPRPPKAVRAARVSVPHRHRPRPAPLPQLCLDGRANPHHVAPLAP